MFAVHVGNPFTASSRREARDKNMYVSPSLCSVAWRPLCGHEPRLTQRNSIDAHHKDREQRDASRKAAWESNARSDGVNRSMQGTGSGPKGKSLADRAKYQFEADSEDEEMENEIDGNLGETSPLAGRET